MFIIVKKEVLSGVTRLRRYLLQGGKAIPEYRTQCLDVLKLYKYEGRTSKPQPYFCSCTHVYVQWAKAIFCAEQFVPRYGARAWDILQYCVQIERFDLRDLNPEVVVSLYILGISTQYIQVHSGDYNHSKVSMFQPWKCCYCACWQSLLALSTKV